MKTQRRVDFRSDTATQPTEAMRDAMRNAVVGDDLLGDDPTVRELERTAAEIVGKEAALFLISGSMANQVAVASLTERGDEVLVEESSHIWNLEVGGLAANSQVQARPLPRIEGTPTAGSLDGLVRSSDLQVAGTALICLENTLDLTRGIPLPPDYFGAIKTVARKHDIPVYLDGARIFNAAEALKVPVTDLTKDVDALMFCLCKGLAAPAGAMLAGTKVFIAAARRVRQRFGGGMRQAGFMAAAGLVALRTMRDRLGEDREKAAALAEGLRKIHPDLVDPLSAQTNIVRLDLSPLSRGKTAKDAYALAAALKEKGFLVKPLSPLHCRMITHVDTTMDDVHGLLKEIEAALA